MLLEQHVGFARVFNETRPIEPPSTKHSRLLSSYLLNLEKGARTVRDMIICDIRGHRDLGAHRHASDLSVVLECFLSRYPEVRPGEIRSDEQIGLISAPTRRRAACAQTL
jgi:hypothetical protein